MYQRVMPNRPYHPQQSIYSLTLRPSILMVVDNNHAFLASVEGEISFFRSIMRARPIGIHRHFHVLAIQRFIHKDTGRLVHINDIWDKLRSCYNLDALEAIVRWAFNSGQGLIIDVNCYLPRTWMPKPTSCPDRMILLHHWYGHHHRPRQTFLYILTSERNIRCQLTSRSNRSYPNGACEQRHLSHHHPHLHLLPLNLVAGRSAVGQS
jgi:hypothetical protein